MKKITISKFKSEFLSLLDSNDSKGIIITRHGKDIARVHLVGNESKYLIGSLKGKIKKRKT